mgnify:CR=1 FL=1
MTERKKKSKKHQPKADMTVAVVAKQEGDFEHSIKQQMLALGDRAYNEGYRDAMKLMKQHVDQQLRETK